MTREIRFRFAVDGAPQAAAAFDSVGQAAQRVGATAGTAQQPLAGATRAVDALGVSSRQTAAAMRQLPAQFTDIATQLAGGQSPFLVLLQQGGQIKDSFGGIGNAARALGSAITPLRVAMGVTAAAALGLVGAVKAGSDEMYALRRTLEITGNAAGLTADRFNDMARAVQGGANTSIGRARDTLLELAGSGRLSGKALEETAIAVERLSKATGEDASAIAKRFVGGLGDIARYAAEINKQYNFLTVAQFKQIQGLQEQGKLQEAAAIAFGKLNERIGDQTKNAGLLERSYHGLKLVLGDVWELMKSIGRDDTLREAAENAQREINRILTASNFREPAEGTASAMRIKALREQLALLRQRIAEEDKAADASAKNAAKEQKGIADLLNANKNLGEAYRDLMADLQRMGMVEEEEALAGGKLSEARQLQIRLYERLGDAAGKLTMQQRLSVKGAIDEVVALKALNDQREREAMLAAVRGRNLLQMQQLRDEGEAEIKAALDAELEVAAKSIKAIDERIAAIRDEEDAVALSRRANISLAEAVERVTIARLQEQRAQKVNDPAALKALDDEIEKRRLLAQVIGGQELRKANEDAAREALRAWQQSVDQISQSLADALMNGGKSFVDYLKSTFRTMVLRPVIQAAVTPLAGSVYSTLGLGPAGYGVSPLGIGNPFGMLGGYGGAGITNAFSSFATSSVGQSLGLSSLVEDAAGNMFLQQGAGSSAFGSALGTVAPYLGAAMAIYSIAKSLDSSGTPHFGGYAAFDVAGRLVTSYGAGEPNRRADLDQLVAGVVKPVGTALNNLVDAFGLGARFGVAGTFKAEDAGKDGGWGIVQISRGAQTIFNRADGTLAGDPTKAFQDYTRLLGTSVREAIDSLDLPGWADGVLAELDESAKTEDLLAAVDGIVQVRRALQSVTEVFSTMDGVFGRIAGSSEDVRKQLADLFGGVDALAQQAGAYYDAFYTDAEKAARSTRIVAEALADVGLEVPQTREAFRALVDAQDPLADSGQRALQALLGVSGAFAELHPVLADTVAAVVETGRSAADIAREREGLESELLRLQGNTAELRARELAALDPSNQVLQQRIYALQDEAIAAAEAQRVEAAASAEAQRVIDAARSAAIKTLSDLAQATERLGRAQDNVRGALRSLQDYRQGLIDQLGQVVQGIMGVRTRALEAVEAGRDRFADAVRAIGRAAESAAERVKAAAAAVDAAVVQRSSAATSIAGFIAGQRGAVGAAQGGVQSALLALFNGRQSANAGVASELSSLLGAQQAASARVVAELSSLLGVRQGAAGGVTAALQRLAGAITPAQQGVDAARQRITDAYLGAQDAATAAQERLAEVQGRAANTTENLAAVMNRLSGSIADYLAELTGQAGTLARRPEVARALFLDAATRAQAGDATAAAQLVGLARGFSASSVAGRATGAQADADQRLIRQVLGQVGSLAESQATINSDGSALAAQLVAAQADVTRTLAEVERLRGIATESGASLTATSVDLLAEWRAAQTTLTTAQVAYNEATAQANAVGITMGETLPEFAAALQSFTSAQAIYTDSLAAARAAAIDLTAPLTGFAGAFASFNSAQATYTAALTAAEDAGVALTAPLTGFAGALIQFTDAQSAFQTALAEAQAVGLDLVLPQAEFAASLGTLAAAQTALDGTLTRVTAAGVDLGLADARDELQAMLDGYLQADQVWEDAKQEWRDAISESARAAGLNTTALDMAAAAGIALGEQSTTLAGLLDELGMSSRSLADAQRQLLEVGGAPSMPATLEQEYRQLIGTSTSLNLQLEEFDRRVGDIDFSGLQVLDPLGDLLQTYAEAVNEMLTAQQELSRYGATGQWENIGDGFERYRSSAGAVGVRPLGGEATIVGINGRVEQEGALVTSLLRSFAAGDLDSIYRDAVAMGISSADLERATGTGTAVLAWARAQGLPAFAGGSPYVPSTGLALVHEGERVITAPDNHRLMDMLSRGADTTELVDEVRALRAEVAQLRAEQRAGLVGVADGTYRTARTLERWDGDGAPVVNLAGTTLETTP